MATYVPKRAMVIVAHPDDIEFSCAGTTARWVKDAAEVCYVLCTSGDVGINDGSVSKEEAVRIREAEQLEAARAVGVTNVVFLREPDGMLEPTMALRKRLVREIRKFRPDTVICGDPQALWAGDSYINHPDHRAAATAAVDAIFPAAGQPALFQELEQEGLTAHKLRKQGTVFTVTVDQLIANIEHPLPMAVIDLDGGGRVYLQVTDFTEPEVGIGLPVTLTFRRLNEGGGNHNYFWKARPLR